MNRRGISLFAQTVLLLILTLVLTQLVTVAMILVRPAPRPDMHPLSEVADVLAGRATVRPTVLTRTSAAAAPTAGGMIEDPRLTARLASALKVPETSVRLYYEADQEATFPWRRGGGRRGYRHERERGPVVWRGEPFFFNRVVAAVQEGGGWRIVRTPARPFLNEWQRWTLIWFGLSTLLLLPVAWIFARRLTRPMRRFVEAADRFGREEAAPALPIEGPAELRTTAKALNRMQARIDDHIRERTSMIGAIAHDLRTPLARIAFRIESAPDELRDKIQADVEQMRAMIAHTLAFVRGTDTGRRREPVDLAALAGRVAREAEETGRKVSLAKSADAVWVSGDPIALERLIDNLVNNAVAFAGAAEIAVDRTGGEAVLAVRDRGPGLSEAMLSRAFEPFERGEPSRSRATGGTGLGLTIARAIARSHGGTLALANRAGGGLNARLTLPLAA